MRYPPKCKLVLKVADDQRRILGSKARSSNSSPSSRTLIAGHSSADGRRCLVIPPRPGSGAICCGGVIAYRIQEQPYGGLKPATVRQLRRMAEDFKSGCTPAASPTASLRPGARLMREWNGDTHVVDVTPDGFTWRGKAYRSLSVIAREITGARWSGPRFFGLKDARK